MRSTRFLLMLCLVAAAFCVRAEQAKNLCPNPGAEERGTGDLPAGWTTEGGVGEWATDEVHAGKRSLKITSKGGVTVGWLSDMIPLPRPRCQFFLRVWAKLQAVSGKNGAFIGIYHTNEKGERIGQSGGLTLGGAGESAATEPWQQYVTVSNIPAGVNGIRVNLRLYGAAGTIWFDDVEVCEYSKSPLLQAHPLRRGMRLRGADSPAIVSAVGGEAQAAEIQSALRARGCEATVVSHDQVGLREEKRDLIILGNLLTNKAAERLYLNSYTYEDLYFPGKGGYVLRPLINPLGTGTNMLVVGASDDAGLKAGVARLIETIRTTGDPLDIPLTVKTGEGYLGLNRYPWPGSGPRAEMALAAAYLKSGDPTHARTYRERILKDWFIPDEQMFSEDHALHLFYVTKTMSWDLMESCGVFGDEERLKVANQVLKMLRSNQGYGFHGLGAGMRCRENHATRAARAFYFGWRHFDKYYRDQIEAELPLWRRKLQDFWASCFASSRSYEDSLSQHALGGSMDNTLDIGFMEPAWSKEFFESGRARMMGDRCIAICNNMGQTVLLGDTGTSDYAASVFSKLGYFYRDGRYQFMIEKRGRVGSSTDEPMRGFAVGLQPVVPVDHIGLRVISADPLYFRTALHNTKGVDIERAFDKLTLRSGFDKDHEYLMLDGVAGGSHSYDDANSIGEYSANGRRWLCEMDIFNGPTMSFHNAVTVARGGLGAPEVPQAAELLSRASEKDFSYVATRLPHYNSAAWTRHIAWLPRKYTFVLDELTAEKPGDYSFVLGWRSLGEPTLSPGVFASAQDDRKATKDKGENRFFLCFPKSVSATLDRDRETLGKYLPGNPYAEPVLNILEQSVGRQLLPGQSACFQNLFYATAGPQPRQCELRRLNEHCALLREGPEIALIGAGVSGAEAQAGALRAAGKFFCIGSSRTILHEAEASLSGNPLPAGPTAQAGAIQRSLQEAWEKAVQEPASSRPSWSNVPSLEAKWTADVPALPLCIASLRAPDGVRLAVGTESGLVEEWSADGRAAGEFKTGGPVHTLCASDLDGDGAQELLVGSDDEQVYALTADRKELWRRKIPFLREEQYWMWWTLNTSKVRKVHADDINGDGKPEVLLGVGNMHLHCLDRAGNELWRFRTDHGTCTTIVTADVFRNGRKRVLAGNGLSSSNGTCWVLDEKGKTLQSYFNGGWCTSLPAIAVGDLDHDGRNTVFCGNNRGDVRAYPAATGRQTERWIHNLTRPVRSLTVLPGAKEDLIAVGSDSGYLCAFSEAGGKVWGLPLSSAILKTALVRCGGANLLAAACKDGKVFLADPEGRLLSYYDGGARLQDMIISDLDGDGTDEIVLALAGPHRLHAVSASVLSHK